MLWPISFRSSSYPVFRGSRRRKRPGRHFEDNAALKAIYYSQFTKEQVFADDSGLEVDALGGEPWRAFGALFGAHGSNEENNRLVLERMRGSRRPDCALRLRDCAGTAGTS